MKIFRKRTYALVVCFGLAIAMKLTGMSLIFIIILAYHVAVDLVEWTPEDNSNGKD